MKGRMEAMMTPKEFSFLTPQAMGSDYRRVCEVAGLDPTPMGWGFLHCVDEDGKRWTAVTDDVIYLQVIAANRSSDALADLELPEGKFSTMREGWPDEWGR